MNIYEGFILRLIGSYDHSAGAGGGAAVAENPFTLIKSIVLQLEGTDKIVIPGTDLRVLGGIISRGRDLLFTPATAAVAVENINAEIFLDFAILPSVFARRGYLPMKRYSSARFEVFFGTVADMISGGTYSTNVINNGKIQVYGWEWSGNPEFEGADFWLNRRNKKDILTFGNAVTDHPEGMETLGLIMRGSLVKQMTPGPETPITTLLTADNAATGAPGSKIFIKMNKEDSKFATTWTIQQRVNTLDYFTALPTGYIYFDFARDGDFKTMMDTGMGSGVTTTELVYDSAGIANAQIRVTNQLLEKSK